MKNKFGMFVHWGIYSILAEQEQVLARNDMNNEEYEQYMLGFNPTEYNPEEWVLLAKNAGMKYICFTAKHHDGFCMWNTKFTVYNSMNTPYGKDILKLLADSCHKHGMLLSIYYSNPDWHHLNAYNSLSSHQWKAKSRELADSVKYREYVKNQITELLTNYGKIFTLFWDIPPRYEDASINDLVRQLQPDILINDRGYSKGDFSTPERSVPEGSRFTTLTEACESVGEQSWGYREKEDYFSLKYLMSSIDKIMSMGGSYLLNVGPMANGKLNDKTVAMIKSIGKWYNKLNGTLEETEEDDFTYKVSGNNVFIAIKKNGKTYLHFYNGLISSCVTILRYPAEPKSVKLLNTGKVLPVHLEYLPAFVGDDGRAEGPFVHITDIPTDELVREPIVLEIEW